MPMTMFAGKTLSWKEDPIGIDTEIEYTDQNGNHCGIDLKKMLEIGAKSKAEVFKLLKKDLESNNLYVGFPIITALNHIANEFPDRVKEIMILD